MPFSELAHGSASSDVYVNVLARARKFKPSGIFFPSDIHMQCAMLLLRLLKINVELVRISDPCEISLRYASLRGEYALVYVN